MGSGVEVKPGWKVPYHESKVKPGMKRTSFVVLSVKY